MRTKSNERKRYSLRIPKNSVVSEASTLDSKKSKIECENNKDNNNSLHEEQITSERNNMIGQKNQEENQLTEKRLSKSKRKGKPSKSASKDEEQFENTMFQKEIHTGLMQEKLYDSELNSSSSQQKETESGKCLSEFFPSDVNEESLLHAVSCNIEYGCQFANCRFLKNWIEHSKVCSEEDSCVVCYKMCDFVHKHAETCETPLEECCLVPYCDRERYIILDKWFKLKHRHNDVIQGIVHAVDCNINNELCNSNLCANIKTVFCHMNNCAKNRNNCQIKKFIQQLCEYHSEHCEDRECRFCEVYKRRKKLADNSASVMKENTIQFNPLKLDGEKNMASEHQSFNPDFSSRPMANSAQSNFFLPNVPWTFNSFNPSESVYSDQLGYTVPPYRSWQILANQPFHVNQSINQPISDIIRQQQQQVLLHQQPECSNWSNNYDAETEIIGEAKPPESACLPISQEEVTADLHSLPVEINDIICTTESTNTCSPSVDSYFPMQRLLSPVQDNRAQFPEPPVLFKEYQTSQESELEENPLPSTSNHCLSNVPQIHECIDIENRIEEMEEGMKGQGDWSKIDFIKEQRLQQGFEAERIAESESDGVAYIQDEIGKGLKSRSSQITNLERTYLNLLQSQNQ